MNNDQIIQRLQLLEKKNRNMKKTIITALLLGTLFILGCGKNAYRNANRFSYSKNGVIVNKGHAPVLTDECVFIITSRAVIFLWSASIALKS